MDIPTPQLPKMMSLMTELCDLMRKVLGKETETDIDVRIAEMMADLNEIKGLMERYTKAMEALVPTTQVMTSISEMQQEMMAQLAEQNEDIKWLCQQLSQSAFRE
jgi:hypothetical protein